MRRLGKLGLVLVGYVLAFVISSVVVMVYDRRFTAADNQTMGGMIAGGEMLLWGGVFVFTSLIPTGLALWFLRSSRPFWLVFSAICITFATLGLAATLTMIAGVDPTTGPLALTSLLAVVQMLGSPIWVGGFALFALLAPAQDLRRRMLIAVGVEVVVGCCAVFHFILRHPPY